MRRTEITQSRDCPQIVFQDILDLTNLEEVLTQYISTEITVQIILKSRAHFSTYSNYYVAAAFMV